MTMQRMEDIAAFLAIVETGGQTAAARQLRRSLQAINRSLAALERSVGVQLIARTTRRSSPTEAGLAFYRRVKPALAEIDEARLEAANRQAEPSGLLRIGAPTLFAPAYVVPAVCAFMTRYPRVEVELKVSDRKVDLLQEELDLAVRIRDLPDSELKARRIGELRMVVYGASSYFARHGRPKHPDELARHDCVLRTVDPDAEHWPFRVAGRRRNVRVRGRFRTDSGAATHAAVAGGLGIGMAPLWQIRELVDQGIVELILEPFETARTPIYAISPPGRIVPAKTRVFTEFLAARLKGASF
jgi:DNA-binding transcriptional LysR family regulator